MAINRVGVLAAIIVAVSIAFSSSINAADGPNQSTHSDLAAGQWVDSLLGPDHEPTTTQGNPLRKRTKPRRAPIRGKLVNNSNVNDGMPQFALLDRYGGILRYVKPEKGIELEAYLGEEVTVLRDTGKVIRASNLELPELVEIDLVDHQEPIPAGEPTEAEESILRDEASDDFDTAAEPMYMEDQYMSEEIDFGGCSDCGNRVCSGGGCGFGSRGVIYARGEYLNWWMKGMYIPGLILADDDDDFFESAATETGDDPFILYGNQNVLEDERYGGRITLGVWLDDYGKWAIEADYLGLDELDERFSAGLRNGDVPNPANGELFIGRPFFNTGILNMDPASRGNSQEDVDTNRLDGSVTVDIRSQLQAAGISLRHNMCCREGCNTCCGDPVGCGSCVSYAPGPLGRLSNLLRNGVRRTDLIYGLRWMSLDESLSITEDLQVITAIGPPISLGSEITVRDMFGTENEFIGGEIGFVNEWERNRWNLRLLSKVAVGNTNQKVNINGFTIVDGMLNDPDNIGGLLTQRYEHPDGFVVGNIGQYERDEFTMIPEIGVTLGYQLTHRLKLTAGYSLIYWGNVVRPGDQIDFDVNANLLPRNTATNPIDPTTVVDNDHPRFDYYETDVWIQGINLGAELGW